MAEYFDYIFVLPFTLDVPTLCKPFYHSQYKAYKIGSSKIGHVPVSELGNPLNL